MKRTRVAIFFAAAFFWASLSDGARMAHGQQNGKKNKKRGSVLFYAGFDKGKNADYAVGNPKARFHAGGGSLCADGRGFRGGALRTGDGEGYLEFSANGNIQPKRGSIEFWMYAEDWEHDDGHVHRLVDVVGNGGIDFRIRQPGVQELIIRETRSPTSRKTNTAYGCNPLKGKWSWFALTWEEGKPLGFYIGGITATGKGWSHDSSGRSLLTHPPKKLLRILIGDFGGIPKRRAHTLIDEVYIYDRALTRDEVTWATENARTRQPGMDIPADFKKPQAKVVPNRAKRTLVVEIDSGDRRGRFSGKARLEPARGTTPATIVPTKGRFGRAVIPYKNLPQGEYKVISQIRYPGTKRPPTSITTKLIVPGPPVWLKQKVGVSDTPPRPWTPIVVKENRVSMWGRNYSLGALGLPTKVETQNISVLAGPIRFRTVSGGAKVSWKSATHAVESRTAAMVVWKGTSRSSLGELTWRTQAEYDGFLLHDLSLMPAKAAKLELMELRIPIRKELGQLYSRGARRRGSLPSGMGKILGAGGYWWLGTDEVGLCGATEHNGALIPGGKGSFSIVRGASGDVTVVYRFLGRPTSLTKPWKLRLILQATPTKPRPANWRTWRDAAPFSGPDADYHKWRNAVKLWVAYPWPHKQTHRSFAFPVVKDRNWYRNHVKDLQAGRPGERKKGSPPKKKKRFDNSVHPYCMLAFMAPGMPECDFYWRQWYNPLGFSSLGDGLYQYAAVRPVPSYIDFIVWKHRELIRQYGHDGLYVDFAGLCHPALALKHGLGYERGGIQYPADLPIVANREIWKRMYTMLRAENGNALIIGHVSENTCVPILSFCDVWINGEGNWFGQLKDNYLDVLPLDHLRAEFRAQHFGGVPWWLPAWQRAAVLEDKDVAVRRKDGSVGTVSVEKTHHMLGIGLLLDIPVWPITGTNAKAAKQLYAVQDEFGMGNVKFFGYWNNAKLIGGQKDGIKASVYRKAQGGALVVVYNTTRQPQTARLTVDWGRLKSKPSLRVIDAYTKTPVAVSGKSLSLQVPRLNHRLLWVR